MEKNPLSHRLARFKSYHHSLCTVDDPCGVAASALFPQSLLSSVQDDPRFMALPGAAAALEALHSEVTSTLSDALLAKARATATRGDTGGS